jgi:hypothetical protein
MVRNQGKARARRSGLRTALVGALLAATLLAPTAQAAEDPLLKKLVGTWIGRGTFRWDSTSEPERLYCKLTATLTNDGAGMKQTGRCAIATDSRAVEIEIVAEGGGVYHGTAKGMGGGRSASVTAVVKDNQIVLTTEVPEGPPPVTTIELFDGGYHIQAERVDPKTGVKYVPAEATFDTER